MKLRNVKTASLAGNKAKPISKKLSSRNQYKTSRSPTSTYNISEIEPKDINPNFQNSMMTLDISFNEKNQEDFNNNSLYKKYLLSKADCSKLSSEISYVDNKIKENIQLIETLSNNLAKLKEEKKEKDGILLDLLSDKESLEEIYKIKITCLKSTYQLNDPTRINGQTNNNQNSNNDNNWGTNILDNNDNIEIKIKDIELCDKDKFLEQVTNFTENIAYKKDLDVRNRLQQKMNVGYQRFLSEINSPVPMEESKIVTNYFSKISNFISSQNRGLYPEHLINSFLRTLLKINRINLSISEILKFLNKKYKDKKVELKEKRNNLVNKNENLKNKKLSFEIQKKELQKFIEENRDKVKNGKNRINLENGNKQCMSFIFDNHLQDDLEFLNEGKNEPSKNAKNISKNYTFKKRNDNRLNENCNGINNINVNNLLINNNIKIENNNNIISNSNNIIENKINSIPRSSNDSNRYKNNKNEIMIKEMVMEKDMKGVSLKKIKLTPQKPNAFHSPSKLTKTNSKNQSFFPITKSQLSNRPISPNRLTNLNNNENSQNFTNNSNK